MVRLVGVRLRLKEWHAFKAQLALELGGWRFLGKMSDGVELENAHVWRARDLDDPLAP